MKSDYIEVIRVLQTGPYRLCLTFSDRMQKTIDLKTYFEKSRGIFASLLKKKEFKNWSIDMAGGIYWKCGADLSAETLRRMATGSRITN